MAKKKGALITLFISLLIMVIGYAAFSTNIVINGTANIASTWQVVFTNIEEVSKSSGVTVITAPTISETNATFNVDLETPGDEIEYKITVENQGTLDAIVTNITATELGSDAIKFKLTDIKEGDILEKQTSTTFSIIISYDNNVTSQPALTDNELVININYTQYLGNSVTETDPVLVATRLSRKILQDNVAQSDENIDFSKKNSDTNGKGLYYTSTNTSDDKISYYFRGEVDNNYVNFAGFYWRIVRINEDGSIRLIYQGTTPSATETDAAIGTSSFNIDSGDNAFIGYMYGKFAAYKDGFGKWNSTTGYLSRISTSSTVKMSTSYKFDSSTGVYTLTNPVDGTYTSSYYNYYTCSSSNVISCRIMIKLTDAVTNNGYNELKGGEIHNGYFSTSYEEAHKNETDSSIKKVLDTWYKNNLIDYADLFADAGFCNDRSLYSGTGIGQDKSYYGAAGRLYYNKSPQFKCPNNSRDLFTLSNEKGNGNLTYPIGLLTADELAYSGGVYGNTNDSYYLYTGVYFWTMSPFYFADSTSRSYEWISISSGSLSYYSVYTTFSVRPVINLIPSVEITSGDGTINKPYVIKTA